MRLKFSVPSTKSCKGFPLAIDVSLPKATTEFVAKAGEERALRLLHRAILEDVREEAIRVAHGGRNGKHKIAEAAKIQQHISAYLPGTDHRGLALVARAKKALNPLSPQELTDVKTWIDSLVVPPNTK